MKERLITAAGALIALSIVYAMFFQRPQQAPVTRPVSTETGRNGYSALRTWLESGGVPVASLQQRFDRLLDPAEAAADGMELAATGNVLITTMPYLIPLRARENQALQAWIQGGNTLLVMAALDDTPEWATPGDLRAELGSLTGLWFEAHEDERRGTGKGGGAAKRDRDGRSAAPGADAPGAAGADTPGADTRGADTPVAAATIGRGTAVDFEPVAAHPLMEGVESLRGFTDGVTFVWQPVNALFFDRLLLRLATERSTGADAAWEWPLGNGRVIVVASGTLLTNHLIADSDAGRFVANVLRHHLGSGSGSGSGNASAASRNGGLAETSGGAVIFDDMHQGLSAIYDPAAFYRDPRLRHSALFLVAAWLAYLLGSSNRFAPPVPERVAPHQGDFLAAAGRFMARRLDACDAGLLLLEEWFDEVRRSRNLPRGGEPPWDALRQTPALGSDTYRMLRRSHERLKTGRPVNLVRLHNTLRQAREAIG